MQSAPDAGSLLNLGAVFTLIVVTLGPVKILGPFAFLTKDAAGKVRQQIAVRAFIFSIITLLVSGVAGVTLLEKWHISPTALELAGGVIFLIVGLRIVLEQYQPTHTAPEPLPESPTAAALKLTFPTIVTPYGIAAVMVLLVNSPDASRTTAIAAVVAGVLVLNLLAMLAARAIMGGATLMILRIVGAVLGVLQVALAIQLIMHSLRTLEVLHA